LKGGSPKYEVGVLPIRTSYSNFSIKKAKELLLAQGRIQIVMAKTKHVKALDSVTSLPLPLDSFPGTLITFAIISCINY
jgi:hypothetical protein